MASKIQVLMIALLAAIALGACAADDIEQPGPTDTTQPGPGDTSTGTGPVEMGDLVSVDYTGTFPNGTMFDTSEGQNPIQVQVGAGMTIPGFEAELVGMEVGENKEFTLSPEQAYGEYDEELIIREEVPQENFGDENMSDYVGEHITVQTEMGQPLQAFVIEVNDEEGSVTLEVDQNHPLAGETLVFDVTLRSIDEMPEQTGMPLPQESEMPPIE